MLVIVCGLPGSGKTFLSGALAKHINATVLSTDKIRKEVLKKPVYTKWERSLVYNIMYLIAKYLHSLDVNCILDGTFNRERSRVEVLRQLQLNPNQFYIVECICPEDIILSRLLLRKNDYSDADISIYFKMKRIYEPVSYRHITVDTSQPPQQNINIILKALSQSKLLNIDK